MDKTTALLIAVGLAVRLFLIFPGPFESKVDFLTNRADLRNYYWPAQAALSGQNPYVLWSTGQSGEFRADMAPLELSFYVATVAIWHDPRAIQILFALFDALNIALLAIVLRHSPLRLPFQIFYAFSPLTLYNLVLVPEDKTIVLTLTFLLVFFLVQREESEWRLSPLHLTPGLLAVVTAGLLAAFKWLSVFYLLPLLILVSSDWRSFVKHGLVFGCVVVLAHLPWFPSWWYVYAFRAARTATPIHIAPAVILNALGLFDKSILMIVLAGSLLLIYALFWFKRIDFFETMALSVAAGVLWTPDMDPVHLSLVVINFLLVVNWTSRARLLLVWGLSLWMAAVYAVSTHTGYARFGLPDLRLITGDYGSLQMILLSYVLFLAVAAFYLIDKWNRRSVGKSILDVESRNGDVDSPEMNEARVGLVGINP